MNIFDFAKDKEAYSEQFYRDLAAKAPHEGLRRILTMLADEEAAHFQIVDRMSHEASTEVADTPLLHEAKGLFEKMKAAAGRWEGEMGQIELYEKARDIEKESHDFYLQKAREVDKPEQRRIFEQLAREEEKHYFLVDNICTFVARPRTYLENAEFNHFDDYVGGVF